MIKKTNKLCLFILKFDRVFKLPVRKDRAKYLPVALGHYRLIRIKITYEIK